MRDPERVEPLFDMIQAVWSASPHLRLCQVLWVAAQVTGWGQDDLFHMSDERLHVGLATILVEDEIGEVMRDPKRIEPLLAQIEVMWLKLPDLRLCQLLSIAALEGGWPEVDLFNLSDERLQDGLSILDSHYQYSEVPIETTEDK